MAESSPSEPVAKQQLFKKLFEDLVVPTTDSVAESSSEFHKAATTGNMPMLIECLNDADANVNLKDNWGHTALYMAIQNGHKDIVEVLLGHGAEVDTDDDAINLYLHICMNVDIAARLIKAGCDINAKDQQGNTALHRVVTREDFKIVTFLLQNGTNVHLQNNEGMLPIHTASKLMSSNVEGLVEAGSNVNAKDHALKTPLHYACENSSCWPAITILLKNGAEVAVQDYRGYYPIHYLIEQYHMSDENTLLQIIDAIITNEEIANLKDTEGQTILHKAVTEVSGNIVEHLLKCGCKANVKDNRDRTPLHYVGKNKQDTDVADVLVKSGGSDINSTDFWGQSPLHTAVENNNITLVKSLVNYGATLDQQDFHGTTPLHVAACFAGVSVGEFLIQMGAKVNAQDNCLSTPLHFGAWCLNYGFCRLLLEHSANALLLDKENQSPMDIAVMRRCEDICNLFTEDFKIQYNKQVPMFSEFKGQIIKRETIETLLNERSISRNDPDLQKYLSGILKSPNIGIALDETEAKEIHSAIENMMEFLSEEIERIDRRFSCTLLRAGSSSEGTKTRLPDEFDFMFCLEEFSKYCYPVYKEDDLQNMLEGSVSNMPFGSKYEDITEKTHSISDYFFVHLNEEKEGCKPFIEFANSTTIPCHVMFIGFTKLIRKAIFSRRFLKDPRITPLEVTLDPSLVVRWRGSRYKVLDIHIDIVPALRLKEWPIKTRRDSILFTPELLKVPCVCVPKMTSGLDEDLWRCSMSLQETFIFRKLKSTIRNSYIAAKAILSSEICPSIDFGNYEEEIYFYRKEHESLSPDEPLEFGEMPEEVVPSYVLKMAFFYSVESKAMQNGLDSVFMHKSSHERIEKEERFLTYGPAEVMYNGVSSLDVDIDLLKDLLKRCEEQLNEEFVLSFFNPKHNVLGQRLVEGDVVKAKMFLQVVNELLK